jgi:TusA-related sulfurtransferase
MDVDARGLKCPLPIIRLTQAMKANPSEPIRIFADDLAFEADVAAWCRKTGNELISLEKSGGTFTAVVGRKV